MVRCRKLRSGTSRDQAWLKAGVWLAGCWSGASGRNWICIGTETPSPVTTASPVPSAGRAAISQSKPSGRALRTLVAGAHRHDSAALRQAAVGQLGRPLADQAQRYAVLAAFPGDAGDGQGGV